MILSGLLTSVAINFALCIIFFTLYSILRKQPGFYKVYAPRMLAAGIASVHRRRHFQLDMLLPNAGWIKNAWHPTEEQLLSYAGLDAVVFMRIITFSFKVFIIAGFVGIFVLIPVNCSGNQLQDVDFINLTNNTLDVFSISNVNNGSTSLWIHLGAVYFVTIIVCYLLFSEYKYISSKRIDYFCSSKPQPEQFTILVSNIPVPKGSNVGNSVENFFTQNHPDTYLSHVVVHRKSKVWTVANAVKKLFKKIFKIRKVPAQQQFTRDGFLADSNVKVKKDKSREFKDLQILRSWKFTFLHSKVSLPCLFQVITGYLPNLILQMSLKIVPPIMKLLSSQQGYICNSEIERSACHKVIWFTVWNVFFANVLSASAFGLVFILLEFKDIPSKLAVSVPAQASFFIAYVVTLGWTSTSSELFRKLPYATSVTLPLPIITLLFNEYCRKRFLPIFMAYSTETLRKKDREDQILPEMPRLLRQVSEAYQDPALVPLSYSSHHNSLREPLIPVAEVRG
ncbi:LOW QUALITY PROTEIN: hypothetical protein M8C21_027795 [Ambrosia artemisiifolia]|uniref:CSC1-like protein n=1 Tax=Ambrosia artemisiifolia TaxID=4212 RepID=A0AAD5GTB9_AMBAR|nr:LOW QUALITY PROTEIN: hypothetical protein M8C21_027795 [Ambrosia artemisiifolia]